MIYLSFAKFDNNTWMIKSHFIGIRYLDRKVFIPKYTIVLKHKNIITIKTKLKHIHVSLEVSVVSRVGGDSSSSKYTASYVATVSTDRLIFAEIVDLLQKVNLV